jgi:hypothetical protein
MIRNRYITTVNMYGAICFSLASLLYRRGKWIVLLLLRYVCLTPWSTALEKQSKKFTPPMESHDSFLRPQERSNGSWARWIQSTLSQSTFLTKNCIIWDTTPCKPCTVNWRFRETCRLHLLVRRISQDRNQHEAGSNRASFLFHLFFEPEDEGRLAFYGLRCVISQKTDLFMPIAVGISSPA